MPTTTDLAFCGARLHAERKRSGYSQQELADICVALGTATTQSHLSLLEADRRRPSVHLLATLATALGVPVASLLAQVQQ